MGLTDAEQSRHDQQRRSSNAWMQIKQAEIQHRNATIVAVGTLLGLLGPFSYWIMTLIVASQTTEEVAKVKTDFAPTIDLAKTNFVKITQLTKENDEFRKEQKEQTKLLYKIAQKMEIGQ